jgi:hypothetical protein
MSGKGMNWRRVGWETRMRDRGTVNVKDEGGRDRAAQWLNRPRPAKAGARKTPAKSKNFFGLSGDPCPRCGVPMQVRKHHTIGEKQLRQPFYYSQWFCCRNPKCKTTMVMPERFKVMTPVVWGDSWPDEKSVSTANRLLQPDDLAVSSANRKPEPADPNERPPWE